MTLNDLFRLAVLTVREPRAAVAQLRGLNLPMEVRWMGFGLVVALSALLTWAAATLVPADVQSPILELGRAPLRMAFAQAGALLIVVWAMAQVGRLFGGQGGFADALLLAVWVQAILIALQAVEFVLMPLFPIVAVLLSIASMALFLYLLAQMVKELHGFRSLAMVAVGMVATAFVLGMILSLLLVALGFAPTPEAA